MTTPLEALDDVLEAARSVSGLSAADADQLGTATLPVVLVGAPGLEGTEFCSALSEATFPVTLLVRLEAGAIRRLLGFLQAVVDAIEGETPAVVGSVVALSYDLGNGVTAAAYELTVTYPL